MGIDASDGALLFAEHARVLHPAFADQLAGLHRKGAHYADGFYERSLLQHGQWTQRAHGRPSPPDVRIRSALATGIALQAHHRQGRWFAATPETTPEAIHHLTGHFPHVHLPTDPVYRSTTAPETALRGLLERTADALLSLNEAVTDVRIAAQSRFRQTLIVTAEGTVVRRTQPLTEVRAEVGVHGANGKTSGVAQQAVIGLVDELDDATPERIARDALAQAERLAHAKPLAPGSYPVVLAAGWGGAWLHEVIGHALEADVAAAAGTMAVGALIAPPHVTLVDDGTHPNGRASGSHDDEGTPASKTTLVRQGRCVRWLTDRAYADSLGMPRTGNGRRASYVHPPLPRMSNLYLAPGTAPPDALTHGVDDGLFAHQLAEGLVDMEARTYRVRVREGRRIEQGTLTHAVRDVWLQGSIDRALHSIGALAHDSTLDLHRGRCLKHGQVVPVGCGLPTTLLSTIHVFPS